MLYANLPGTNLKVSVLSLGTMMFGKQTQEADAIHIIDYAIENGVNFIDTADVYNNGESERIVGKALKGKRDSVYLATKVGGGKSDIENKRGLSRKYILSEVEKSLKKLDTDYIDLYYMHTPDHITNLEESLQTMDGLVKCGKIRYIGVSNYAAWQIADMMAICDKRGYAAPVMTQNVYNSLTRGVENELVPFLLAHGMGLAAYNPLAGGFLSGKHKPGQPAENTRFANEKIYMDRYWNKANFEALEKFTSIAEKFGLSLLQLSLKWCASQSAVTSVVCGVSRLEQIKSNIEAINCSPLPQEILIVCDEVWHKLEGERFSYIR
jgi:aryl-alcohol dehydrogenase-like predicted oxidoreductase